MWRPNFFQCGNFNNFQSPKKFSLSIASPDATPPRRYMERVKWESLSSTENPGLTQDISDILRIPQHHLRILNRLPRSFFGWIQSACSSKQPERTSVLAIFESVNEAQIRHGHSSSYQRSFKATLAQNISTDTTVARQPPTTHPMGLGQGRRWDP